MINDAMDRPAWDLAVPSSMRNRFDPTSFYIVIDGISAVPVQATARQIKEAIIRSPETRVRGPLAMPTERRRNIVMKHMLGSGKKGQYIANPKRYRQVLLVINPTSACIAGMISMIVPQAVNVKIEPYQAQFELRDDR